MLFYGGGMHTVHLPISLYALLRAGSAGSGDGTEGGAVAGTEGCSL